MQLKSLSPQYFKRLHIKYALALTFIAVVLLSSSFLIQKSIDDNSADSRVINISGRQRMLSQKISKTALIIKDSKSADVTIQALSEMNNAIDTFTKSHHALQYGNIDMGLPEPTLSPEIEALFKEIAPFYDNIVTAAERINSNIVNVQSETTIDVSTSQILSNEKRFLPLMDSITFTFDKEAKAKIDKLKSVENLILVIGFIVLLFEFLSIFRPSIKELGLAVKNITEKQDQLKEANNALAHALDESQRLTELANAASDAKSTFLANMSHEIRTPMNSILGFAEIMDTKIDNPVHKHYLSNMISSGRMLLALINDILDLSKIEAGKLSMNLRSVDIHKVCNEISETFSHMSENKGLDFSYSIDLDIPRGLLLDEIRLRQVLFNILGNAVKFTDRGSISLKVSIHGISDKHSTYNILFEIEDTGVGIPQEAQEKIFEAFEQQSKQDHRKYGGTGLGLSITQKLVKMMNGEISLESKPRVGSKFSIRFDEIPVASVVADSEEKYIKYTFQPAKIMIVDDVEMNRELLAEYLTDEPFELIHAENGQDALAKIHRVKPDLILTDMRMPVMDGYELTAKLKNDADTKNIPVIAVTASSMEVTEQQIREICDDYLQKPVSGKKLFKTLVKFLNADASAAEHSFSLLNTANSCNCEDKEIEHILNILDNDFMQKLEEQAEILSYDEIKALIKSVKQTATPSKCSPLLGWATEAENCLALFDMEKLESLLKELKPILEDLSKKL